MIHAISQRRSPYRQNADSDSCKHVSSSSSFWAPRFGQVREGFFVLCLYLPGLCFIILPLIITSVLLQFLKYHRLLVEPGRRCFQLLSREQVPQPLPGPENVVTIQSDAENCSSVIPCSSPHLSGKFLKTLFNIFEAEFPSLARDIYFSSKVKTSSSNLVLVPHSDQNPGRETPRQFYGNSVLKKILPRTIAARRRRQHEVLGVRLRDLGLLPEAWEAGVVS